MISSSTSRSSSRKPDIILKWLTFLQVLNVLDIFLWGRTMKGEGFCQHRSSRQNYFPKSCRWKSSPSSCHSVVIFAEYFIVLFVKNVFVDIWIRFNSRGHDMTNQTIPHHKMVFQHGQHVCWILMFMGTDWTNIASSNSSSTETDQISHNKNVHQMIRHWNVEHRCFLR